MTSVSILELALALLLVVASVWLIVWLIVRRRQRVKPLPARADASERPELPPIAAPPPPAELLSEIRSGECVVVLGSGMSAQAGLPSWSSLVKEIIHEALAEPQIAQFDRLLESRPIDDVVESLNALLTPTELTKRIVDATRRHKRPDMAAYSILAELPVSALVSLNLDDLAVRAFKRRAPQVFLPSAAETCLNAFSRNEFFVFMLNGSVDAPHEILLSHQNLKDAVSRNEALRDLLRRLYYSRPLFFLGVSLSGIQAFFRTIDRTAEPSKTHYALVEVSDSTWEPIARNLEAQFRLKVLPFTPSRREGAIRQFLQGIDSQIDTAIPTAAANARSVVARVELRNIGPFTSCALDIDSRWTVLLGDNGVGKSSALRAIAVGLCGKASEPFAARLLKSKTSLGEIKLNIGGKDYVTTIKSKSGGGVTVESPLGIPLENERILAVGYPALRTVGGQRGETREATPERPNAADLAPLTSEEPDPHLDGIKQWITRVHNLKNADGMPESDRQRYSLLYDRIFAMLSALTAGVELKPAGVNRKTGEITIQTKDGPIPFESLSQGTLSLVGWAGALMQRLYETAPEGVDPIQSPVIVLVDEIDAHMHPAWQQALVQRLSETFPNAQFIVTSHSPLVVAGLEPSQVHRFERDASGVVQITQPAHSLKGVGAAGLLTSDLFGLASQLDIETAEALNRKRQLTAKRLEKTSPNERAAIDAELEQLEKQVQFVDATRFIRDPLYQRFVDAISRVQGASPQEAQQITLTPEEKKQRAQVAEAIVRDLVKSEAEGQKGAA